jgi:hypothetical protein
MNASAAILAGPRIELGTERESLLQVLDEDADFRGNPAACRPNGHDRHSSFEGSQKTDNSAFSEFCSEEPCRRLGNPQVFKDPHPHLFDIASTKDSCWNNPLRFLSGSLGDSGAPYRERYCGVATRIIIVCANLRATRVESGSSPEWIAKSKPSSIIVAGLSDAAISTAMSG